ncbi:MAG: CoA-binding protein [Thermodesulfobacteriota bacterium]|nr:CoA-binding protein [Thermodesulfobacteriota bacterium]
MSLERLFYPRSIAVIGASPSLGGGKLPYYQILQMFGYKGKLYPVNPKYTEINGDKVYANLDDIPESVDFAIASVPANLALETVKAAVKNGTKFLHFFTSGFSEVGNFDLEKEMLAEARKGPTRIVGPNCIGIHCTESGITCDIPRTPTEGVGNVAFLGQSGGMTHNFMRMVQSRYLDLNKVVSYGNQIDLCVEDYIEYLAADDSVKVIAAYIEDIKNPRRFLEVLKKTTPIKPVIILKGGTTDDGAKAAASHTGAMAACQKIWAASMRQCDCIEAHDFERMVDLVMQAVARHIPRGRRLGFLGAGGGTSVLFTDLAAERGMLLPELSEKTQKTISEKISNVNTSTMNPVDLGFYGFDFNIMAHTIEAMADDDNIDAIIPYFSLDFITSFQSDQIESGPHIIKELAKKINKPILPILSRFTENMLDVEEARIKITSIFRKAGLAVYGTPQDAIDSINNILKWSTNHYCQTDPSAERKIS